jgi:hypothetical protein
MLHHTIQVGNLSPRPISRQPQCLSVAQAFLPVPPYERTSTADPCLKPLLRSFAISPRRFTRATSMPYAHPLVLQSLHAREHATGPLALLRRNVPRPMAHRPPGLPRIRRRYVHNFRRLRRPRSLAPMEDAPRPLADRLRNRLRSDDGDLRPCILPPRPSRQIT